MKYKKKKILFINGHMSYGGVERSLLDLLRNINYEKYEVDLLLLEGKGEYFENIPIQTNIIYKNLNNTHGSFIKSIGQCLKQRDLLSLFTRILFLGGKVLHPYVLKLVRIPLLGNKAYDFAVAYRTGICTALVEYVVKAKNKTTWWHHGEINLLDEQLKAFEKTCIKFKNIVVVSKSCEKMLIEVIPSIRKYITIIPNMIDIKNINVMALKFTPNFNKEKKHFVTACRIAPEKHIENVIYTSELLIQQGFTNFQWHIIGDGDDLKKMQALSNARKTTNHILFEGKKANPYPFIKYADIYIHTSYIESQGLSILEAMALKTPCIITDNAGIRDYANINNSIIVNQGVEPLVNAILEIAYDRGKYNLLKQGTKCPDKFIAKNIIKKIEQFLE
jgi:glycosyltransferase involved in cell wall biosynthesis